MKRKIYKAYLISVIALVAVGLILRNKQLLVPTITFAILILGADNIIQAVLGPKDLESLHWVKGIALLLVGVCSLALCTSIGHATTPTSIIVAVEAIFALVALNCLRP